MIHPITLCAAVLLLWSVFAFGGVYPWASWPIAIGCLTAGLLGSVGRYSREGVVLRPWCLILLLVGSVQLLPVPEALLFAVSPGSRYFRTGDTVFNTGVAQLSLVPSVTLGVLGWIACLAALFLALLATVDFRELKRLNLLIVLIGCGLALAGLAQGASDHIYGFWEPRFVSLPFGPFVNRNHAGGWMVMALSCGIGLFIGKLEARRPAHSGWQRRLLSLTSPESCQLALLGLAILTMGVGLAVIVSRSAMLSVGAVLATTACFAVARRRARPGRSLRAGYAAVVVVLAGSLLWAGIGPVEGRFREADRSLHGRTGVWTDTLRIVKDFPLTGAGLGSFRSIFPRYADKSVDDGRFNEAHNDYLQLVAEGGLLVMVPAVLLGYRFAREVRRRLTESASRDDYWIRAGAVTALCGLAVQEVVEFSLRTPAIAILFVVCCATAVHPTNSTRAGII